MSEPLMCALCVMPLYRCSCGHHSIKPSAEYNGGSVDYYQVNIEHPTTEFRLPYIAECNDIIEALGMNFAEGNAFKAIWRKAAHRTLGKAKAGAKADGLYDAQKVEFFGKRLVVQAQSDKEKSVDQPESAPV